MKASRPEFAQAGVRGMRQGFALVMVVAMLALALVLLLALMSTTKTEWRSAVVAADGSFSRAQADSAVNIVISQIAKATQQNADRPGREIWTSQPGMVRQYGQDGALIAGYKLYSDRRMFETTEDAIAADTPPDDWDTQPAHYVDLNEPVARQDGHTGLPQWNFPIIDPRAFSLDGNGDPDVSRTVEGFSYTNKTAGPLGSGSQTLNGVVLPNGQNSDAQRLPMPVEWLYLLEDGTLGTLDDAGTFLGANGEVASASNPIVSRIAFWADDESAKININTAGEGTYWDTPRMLHTRDADWGLYQPMRYEYQRYPGHPASVNMSTVLYPGSAMNPPRATQGYNIVRERKETIYDLMPKILRGGSQAGTIPVPSGRNFTPTDFVHVQDALKERLFATVDDFLLQPQVNSKGLREEINLGTASLWSGQPTASVIERLRFFLSANSRAPELNPFGLPKISIWPVHADATAGYQTVFDRSLVHAATLSGAAYYFTRRHANHEDELAPSVNARNHQLFEYLRALTAQPIPGFGDAGASFLSKYGENRDSILLSIFDYIRSTNSYDDGLAEDNLGQTPTITRGPVGRITAYDETGGLRGKTFTPLRKPAISSSDVWPGHNQVVPTAIPRPSGGKMRGMGRFPTISEAGMHFICTAQGTDRAGGAYAPKVGTTPTGSEWGDAENWYSNFPPLSAANQDPAANFYGQTEYGGQSFAFAEEGRTGAGIEGDRASDDAEHPGYKPRNWNWTLDRDTPLPPNTKRIQATILLEWFFPSAGIGWTDADFQIEIDASDLKVNGRALFPRNSGISVIKPSVWMTNARHAFSDRGGTVPYRAFLARDHSQNDSRHLPPVSRGVGGHQHGSLPGDYEYGATSPAFTQAGTIVENNHRYDLVSDFFDIPADGKIPFDGGKVVVRIQATSRNGTPVLQTINLDFPTAQFNAPELVRKSAPNPLDTDEINAPTAAPCWWAFHRDGALGRPVSGTYPNSAATNANRLGGRFRSVFWATTYDITERGDALSPDNPSRFHRRGNFVVPEDTLQTLVIRHGDPRLLLARSDVPESEFVPHRLYGLDRRMANNLFLASFGGGVGIDRGDHPSYPIAESERFITGAKYLKWQAADLPLPRNGSDTTRIALRAVNKYGDFDRGVANQEDGAYINRPDEGDTHRDSSSGGGAPYFGRHDINWSSGAAYFTPNRLVSSPGMFGSLPTGVFEDAANPSRGARQEAWRTLLFRPSTWRSGTSPSDRHPGAPASLRWSDIAGGGIKTIPLGGENPADYLLMDFFWMPVVEPYPISQPGSTAGKINLNYQMAPFRHIRRATGLAAALKSEVIHSIPVHDADKYLYNVAFGALTGSYQQGVGYSTTLRNPPLSMFWNEGAADYGNKFWHREVDVDATLRLFDERLANGFAFISPAQIAEMPLLPSKGGYFRAPAETVARDNATGAPPSVWPDNIAAHTNPDNAAGILAFWNENRITGENLRERPYSNLYPKLTTRSNVFQVHLRAQSIRKARSSDPAKFVEGRDQIISEYRGSALIERYLDLSHPGLAALDSAGGTASEIVARESLDSLHRFRIISQKRFH